MGGGFEQGAVYVPRHRRSGKALPAPDEDSFTMGITALESLGTGSRPTRPSHVHLVGEFPSVVDWAIPAFLGSPVAIEKHPGDARGLVAAVDEAARAADDSTSFVIAVDPDGSHGALAAVLRFGSDPSARAPHWGESTDPEGAADLARAALMSAGIVEPPTTDGSLPPDSWTPETVAAFASTGLSQVSEGAYVPRPRYLENLPSRWRLEGDHCAACARTTYPRRDRCLHCGRADRLSPVLLPRDGARVVGATIIGKGGQPTEFDPQVAAFGGYGVVLAEFAPGVRLTLQVTDATPGEIRIGDRIGTRLRRLYPMEGEWRYGRKAVPLTAEP
jgi:uncharacterized OB-fold protein